MAFKKNMRFQRRLQKKLKIKYVGKNMSIARDI